MTLNRCVWIMMFLAAGWSLVWTDTAWSQQADSGSSGGAESVQPTPAGAAGSATPERPPATDPNTAQRPPEQAPPGTGSRPEPADPNAVPAAADLDITSAQGFLAAFGMDPNLAGTMELPAGPAPAPQGRYVPGAQAQRGQWRPGFGGATTAGPGTVTPPSGDAGAGSEDWLGALGALAKMAEPEPEESVNLNNVEMRVIIQKLGDWTGKPIIPTDDEVLQKRITIYASKRVPRSRALSLIYAALRARGVIAEHTEDKIFLKPIAQARQGYVPTLGPDDPLARIADKSMVVEKFFRLKNYDATRLAEIITPLLAEYGHVTALASTNDVVVIDTVENLMRVERIVRQLDVPESEQVVEQVFEIQHADPAELVQLLQLILAGGDSGRSRSRSLSSVRPELRPSSSRSSESRPATSVTIDSGQVPIRLLPMPKQRWIIARASDKDMDEIEKWIKRLDVPQAAEQGQTVIPVRYVDPREVARAVESALRDMPGTEWEASVVVEALTQSKQIVVWGSEENRRMVERLVAEVDLPSADVFIERTFKLKYADPDQIKENIEGLYGDGMSSRTRSFNPFSRYYGGGSSEEDMVKVISYPTLRQVTVIASEKNMAKIARQITEEWDVPLDITKDQYRILTLHNSDPVQIAQLLTTLFSSTDSGGSNNFIRMIFGGRGTSDDRSKIVGSLYGMFTFEAVPGTKKIIVISKIPEAYAVIEKLVKDLDSEEKAEVPEVITLNYADAEDLCDQLNALLNEPGTTATLRRSSRGLSEYSADAGSSTAAQQEDQSAGTITPWWNRQARRTDEELPASNLIGKVRFIPVHRSKAILVLAPTEYMPDIREMIRVLDQPGMQVMVKVVIMSVDRSNIDALGVKYSTNAGALGDIGNDALRALGELTWEQTRGNTALTFTTGLYGLIDLLVTEANARILNQPTLWTKDNKEAAFIKGQEIAFLEQSQTDASNPNSIINSYNYRDVGITLRIRPNITPEKNVDLTINLQISEVGQLVNNQVSTNKLDTTTSVIVKNGQTVILGGILTQKESEVVDKLPLLGDIPIVGEAFKHTDKEISNDELLVFLTPYVIDANTLELLPADTDEVRQIEGPRQRMERITTELDQAIRDALGADGRIQTMQNPAAPASKQPQPQSQPDTPPPAGMPAEPPQAPPKTDEPQPRSPADLVEQPDAPSGQTPPADEQARIREAVKRALERNRQAQMQSERQSQ